jgi:hypothetical protein
MDYLTLRTSTLQTFNSLTHLILKAAHRVSVRPVVAVQVGIAAGEDQEA